MGAHLSSLPESDAILFLLSQPKRATLNGWSCQTRKMKVTSSWSLPTTTSSNPCTREARVYRTRKRLTRKPCHWRKDPGRHPLQGCSLQERQPSQNPAAPSWSSSPRVLSTMRETWGYKRWSGRPPLVGSGAGRCGLRASLQDGVLAYWGVPDREGLWALILATATGHQTSRWTVHQCRGGEGAINMGLWISGPWVYWTPGLRTSRMSAKRFLPHRLTPQPSILMTSSISKVRQHQNFPISTCVLYKIFAWWGNSVKKKEIIFSF